MRIGLFSDTYVPEINGVASSTHILKCELEKHGHDVFVVTTYAGGGHAKWDEEKKVLRLAGMELKFLYGYVMTSPIHIAAYEEVKNLNLDIIHAQTEFGVGIFARICASQLKIPLVSTYHTTYEDYTHYVNFINSKHVDALAKKGVAKISKLYGDSSVRVIAPSEKTKQMLLGYGITKEISVIPTGLQLDTFHPSLEDVDTSLAIREQYGFTNDDHVIIYVGRIAEEKSLDLVIRGFHRAIERGIDVKLLIVGGGPSTDDLQKMIDEYQIGKNVILCGVKQRSEVPDYYRACDGFISASLSETQGMTFIEALASGLPIIARHDEVLDDLIIEGKTGQYFTDEDDLADILGNIAGKSRRELKQHRDECLEIVKPYSSEHFYESVVEVYESAVEEYSHHFHIEDIKVKDSTVLLYLESESNDEKKIEVSIDDYYEYGLRKDGILVLQDIERLENRQSVAIAYQACIKKLSAKDRTRKEIEDYLRKDDRFDQSTVNTVLNKLEEKGYLNDEKYTNDAISNMKSALQGPRKIIQNLKKHGVQEDVINAKTSDLEENMEERARAYGEKILHGIHHESVRKAKMTVQKKLMVQGYSQSISQSIANELDYSELRNDEIDSLRICANKAYKKYQRKYEGTDLRNHVFRYCAVQGYDSEDIYVILDEME